MKIHGWHYFLIVLLIGLSVGAFFGGVERFGLKKVPIAGDKISRVVKAKGINELLPLVLSKNEHDARLALLRLSQIKNPKIDNILLSIYENGVINEVNGNQARLVTPGIRLRAAQLLINKKPELAEGLSAYIFQYVNSDEDRIRAYAVNALGNVKSEESVDYLVGVIKNDTNYVVSNALASLQRLASGEGTISIYAFSELSTLRVEMDTWNPVLRHDIESAYIEAKRFRSQWDDKKIMRREIRPLAD